MKKVAVLLAGPVRYLESVISRIDKYSIDATYFIYVWGDDLGNKVRADSETLNIEQLVARGDVAFFTIAKPYGDEDYSDVLPITIPEGLSKKSNIMGMYKSMEVLVAQLAICPRKFDYAMRLRTDCLLLDDHFFDLTPKSHCVYVSKNYQIPHAWVSDHIMAAKVPDLIAVWFWRTSKDLYSMYMKNDCNPEKLLAAKVAKLNLDVVETWVRYRAYHVVYSPPMPYEPEWIHKALKQGTVSAVFESPEAYYEGDDVERLLEKQKANQDYYAKPKAVKAFIRLKRIFSAK